MLVVGLPLMVVVSYHRTRDRLIVDIWSQIDPRGPRAPEIRSSSTRASTCDDLDGYVRTCVGDFLKETGPWFYKR
jgi:hypothetical protein